jgi:quinol monooxygenase YgiN
MRTRWKSCKLGVVTPMASVARQGAGVLLAMLTSACGHATQDDARAPAVASSAESAGDGARGGMMVRIAELDIEPAYVDEYRAILKEEAEASVRLEPGVLAILPMVRKDDPTVVRILEIYASRDAYEAHLKTPHFQKYKTTTAKMVKALRLVDMDAVDPSTMGAMFEKM